MKIFVTFIVIFLLCLVIGRLYGMVRDLEKRIEVLELEKHYRGKDADGNEVWSARTTVVEIIDCK
jgi:hypothetical protein